MKTGDYVELVSKEKSKRESYNWIAFEKFIPKKGDMFKVLRVTSDNYLLLEGLKYRHPVEKFLEVK